MPLVTDLPPPDWYTDPEDPAQYRYWDGSQWTDHRAPRHSDGSGHRSVRDLLSGTWRMATQNWRPLLIIYAVVAVVYLAAEQAVTVGTNDVFGDTLGALISDLESLDPDASAEETEAVLEGSWNDLTDRLRGLDSSTLATGALLMVVGAVAAIAVNIVEFAAFGQFTVARLGHRPAGAARALRAGLGRLLRMIAVGLMLLAIWCAALMVAGLVSGVLGLASGVLGALLAVVLFSAVLATTVGAAPLALLAVMTAAVGPATPSLRYARNLVNRAYWATFGRMALLFVLSTAATVVLVLVAGLVGLLGAPLERVVLVVLGVLPEALFSVACFTVYHDLGGEHADPVASPGSELPAG